MNSSSIFTRCTRIYRIYRGYDSKICDDKFDIHMPLLHMPVDTMSIVLVLQSNVDQFVIVQCILGCSYTIWVAVLSFEV